jgi:hypothetical protein
MINTSIPIFKELVDCLQLSLSTFSIIKPKLIIYFRKYHKGLPFRHSALFRDNMVEEKMNVVVVSAMSQISNCPSGVTALSCLLQRPPL